MQFAERTGLAVCACRNFQRDKIAEKDCVVRSTVQKCMLLRSQITMQRERKLEMKKRKITTIKSNFIKIKNKTLFSKRLYSN